MSTRSGKISRFSTFHQPGDPDAAFVKQRHWKRHRDESQQVRRRRNNSGEDKNEHDRIRAGAGHEFVSDETEINQSEDDHRQFKRQSETENEFRYERIILLHRPSRRPSQRLGVAEKEENRFRKQPEIADEYAQQKEAKAPEDCWK